MPQSDTSCIQGAPPAGYARSERVMSDVSTSTAFETGLDKRDTFLGVHRCVVCGRGPETLEHCHIIPQAEPLTWTDLQQRGWLPVPGQTKGLPRHEPRNGLVLCRNHHALFDGYHFFIRFFPEIKKYVMIDYSDQHNVDLRPFHGKAVALDITDHYAPFPSLFIIHEMRVRGHRPFHDTNPLVPPDNAIDWQEWIETTGLWDDTKNCFHRHGSGVRAQPQMLLMTPMNMSGSSGVSASGTRRLEISEKVISDILAATRSMQSWKECEMEGKRWVGTAEENRKKYLSVVDTSV